MMIMVKPYNQPAPPDPRSSGQESSTFSDLKGIIFCRKT